MALGTISHVREGEGGRDIVGGPNKPESCTLPALQRRTRVTLSKEEVEDCSTKHNSFQRATLKVSSSKHLLSATLYRRLVATKTSKGGQISET